MSTRAHRTALVTVLLIFLVGLPSCTRTERGIPSDNDKWNPNAKPALFRQAMASRSAKELEEFYDRYRSDGDPTVAQAAALLQDVLYAQIKSRPTADTCDDFLNRFPDGTRSTEMGQVCEPALFDRASQTRTVFACKSYLQRYRQGYRREQVREIYDATLFDRVRSENLVESYEAYLNEFPAGKHIDEARSLLDPLLFDEVMSRDSRAEMERYLRLCPEGKRRLEASERLWWLRSHRAMAHADYPSQVWIDEKTPTYSWKIVFKEQGGEEWYSVAGKLKFIDPDGASWVGVDRQPFGRRSVRVSVGGETGYSDWVSVGDHALCNGYAEYTWTGEDAGGHPVSMQVRIHLIHLGCPGKKR